jgi:signal recognition particle receptor subunit beta
MDATQVDLLVIGTPQTGKSTLINTLAEQTFTDNKLWHYGLLYVNEQIRVQFMEPPSQANFDYLQLREVIAQQATDGMIVMLDARDTNTFGGSVSILETIHAHHPTMPVVVGANYQDIDGAWSAQDIQMGLGIPEHMPVVACSSHNMNLARELVLALLYKVLGIAT